MKGNRIRAENVSMYSLYQRTSYYKEVSKPDISAVLAGIVTVWHVYGTGFLEKHARHKYYK